MWLFTIISYCGRFLLVWVDLEPAHHINPEDFECGCFFHIDVCQMCTEPLHLSSPHLSPLDPDEEVIGHMLLSHRCNLGEETRVERRRDILVEALLCSLSESERYWKRRRKRRKKRGRRWRRCAVLAHTLLLSSWQTSYLTQLIIHLITVSA